MLKTLSLFENRYHKKVKWLPYLGLVCFGSSCMTALVDCQQLRLSERTTNKSRNGEYLERIAAYFLQAHDI